MNLSQAKVLITGGSTGIGFAIAKQLKAAGAAVTIASRNATDLEKACQQLGVWGLATDVTDEQQVKKLVEYSIEKMDGLNVLINNAGIGYFQPLLETELSGFTQVWETNVKGAFLMGKACATYFVKKNYGNIINIGSTAAQKGFPSGTSYCASKFALTAMTQCWKDELRKSNIRVMQVNPSEVDTPIWKKMGIQPKNLDRKLRPSEIAHTVEAMLKMDDVGFITDVTVWATNP